MNCLSFVTLNFETANEKRDSPCEVGLTFVEKGEIINSKSWLIRPKYDEFDFFNILVHGITPADVANMPEFDVIWDEMLPLIKNKFLVSHNAGFHQSVLRRTLSLYNIEFPNLEYVCSYIFSKKIWSGLPDYSLESLARNIKSTTETFKRSEEKSKFIAELTLSAIDLAEINSLAEFPEKLMTVPGRIFPGGYKACETKRVYKPKDLTKIVGDPIKLNPESIFYGRSVVFTGTLFSMARLIAQQNIVDIGGYIAKGVTKETDFLVVGHQDYKIVGDDGMSNKQEKAIKIIDKGSDLEILSESDFLKNI